MAGKAVVTMVWSLERWEGNRGKHGPEERSAVRSGCPTRGETKGGDSYRAAMNMVSASANMTRGMSA